MYEATVSYQIGNHTMHRLRKKKKIKYDIDENISRSFCINIQKFRTVNSSYKGHLLYFYLSFFFSFAFSYVGSRARIRYFHETSDLTSEFAFP